MAKKMRCAITTVDNPYDPFDEFSEWYRYDMDKGYNSCGVLDRFIYTSNQFTDEENAYETERAIDYIIAHDPLNRYKKVNRSLDLPDES